MSVSVYVMGRDDDECELIRLGPGATDIALSMLPEAFVEAAGDDIRWHEVGADECERRLRDALRNVTTGGASAICSEWGEVIALLREAEVRTALPALVSMSW